MGPLRLIRSPHNRVILQHSQRRVSVWMPGLAFSLVGAAIALGFGGLFPSVPILTFALVLGLVVGQIPVARHPRSVVLNPGTRLAGRRLLRIGIVLLGFKVSIETVAALGWLTVFLIVILVAVSFGVTWGICKLFRLPGNQPLMMAAGFSICGVSAIGAMAGTVRTKQDDTPTPVALVTLYGSIGILLLPAIALPLGLSGEGYGMWVGASLHDVGQVVAAGQTGGAAALAIAVTVKLARVLTLAPMVAIVGAVERGRTRRAGEGGDRAPLMPLFVVAFIGVVLLNSTVEMPAWVHNGADVLQTVMFAAALFAIGFGIRLAELIRAGRRAVLAGAVAWAIICILALGVVWIHVS